MSCEANTPQPSLAKVRKYTAECGQDSRPGRPAKLLTDEDDPHTANWVGYDGKLYKWTTHGHGREYYKTAKQDGLPGLYKNHKGCTRYTEKKKACDPLHPNNPNRKFFTVNKNSVRDLANLMNEYITCIKSMDHMNKCVVIGDQGHADERARRNEDLVKITKWYNDALRRRDELRHQNSKVIERLDKALEKAGADAAAAEDNAAAAEDRQQEHRKMQGLQQAFAKREAKAKNAKVDDEAAAALTDTALAEAGDELRYESMVESLNNAYENAMIPGTRARRSNAVNNFCIAWNDLRLFPTLHRHSLHKKKITLLDKMQTNIQDYGDDKIKEFLRKGKKCKIKNVDWERGNSEWDYAGFKDAAGGQRKKTKKAKMKRKHKKTKKVKQRKKREEKHQKKNRTFY